MPSAPLHPAELKPAAASFAPGLRPMSILFVALALSIGWGVRGNWGHEYGAMIPGALAAMAAVMVSGREDWYRRIPAFAFYGALGWSFGGSMSYMQVIAYTHSGHGPSVAYGFACLFLMGFLWGALGGTGTGLPIFLDRARLTALLLPTAAVFAGWIVLDQWLLRYLGGMREQVAAGTLTVEQLKESTAWLNWHDTDWLGVLVALVSVGIYAAVRRHIDWGTGLVLAMCVGWWLGFGILRLGLGLRMTPPRGDNWSGSLGTVLAVLVYLWRTREFGIVWSTLVIGFFGGLAFSGSTFIKLVLVHPTVQEHLFGGQTDANWHSVLEQTFGFIAGFGEAIAIGLLATRAPRQTDEPTVRRWAEPACVFFVLVVITYVNIVKNIEAVWLGNGTVPAVMYGWAASTWFNLMYLALALAVGIPLWAHWRGRPIAMLPTTWLGRGQLLFLVFLWWIVVGNLTRTVPFHPQRLITEGTVHVNACLCTLMALLLPSGALLIGSVGNGIGPSAAKKALATVCVAAALVIGAEIGTIRWLWGDTFAGHAALHIRFGPNATTEKK